MTVGHWGPEDVLSPRQVKGKISFPRENEAIKHDLVEFKVQCLKVFCYHGNKSTILLLYSIFRTTPEDSSNLYFVEIC